MRFSYTSGNHPGVPQLIRSAAREAGYKTDSEFAHACQVSAVTFSRDMGTVNKIPFDRMRRYVNISRMDNAKIPLIFERWSA